jgi:iron complex outermembrane recepter protein
MLRKTRLGGPFTLATAMGVCAQPALAQTSPAESSPQQDAVIEEIVVTGLRKSIQDAIATKRSADSIVDSISAQDIGKLPDQNVVDTLSRIPGVQITRSRGDGANFTIRGISLNNTLINGRPFIGATSDASPRLDVLSSDIVGSIDVIKSPSADMIEGALGGTVNMKTKRPLDLPATTVALRAQGQYADTAEDYGFRGSALMSKRFAEDRAGVLFNAAYQYLQAEEQLFDAANYARVNDIDGNGDGVNDPGLFRPTRFQTIRLPRPVERITLNSVLQFQPADTINVLLEGTYNRFDARGNPQRYQTLLNSNDAGAMADSNGTVVSGRLNGVTQRPLVYQEDDRSNVMSFAGRVEWNPGAWSIATDLSYGRGRAPFDLGTFTVVMVQRAGRTISADYNLVGTDVPSYNLNANFDVNDPSQYQVQSISDNSNTNDNEAAAGRLDFARDLTLGPVSRVGFGYRYEDRTFNTARRVLSASLGSLVAVADTNRDGIVTADEIPGIHYKYPLSRGVLSGLSGAFPENFLGGSVDAAAVRKQFGYSLPPIAPTTVSDVNIESNAGYVRVDFQGDVAGLPIRANIGTRATFTDRESAGNIDIPGGGTQPVSYRKSYTDVLPSGTLTLDLRDDLLLRLAAARVVATPPLSDLAAGFTYSIVSNTGSGGNPMLDPYKAAQADLSLEWYFGSGNLLAASVFTKDVESFTKITVTPETLTGFINPNGTGNVFLISRPDNGSDGKVSGFELNYQQSLSFLPAPLDGIGLQANYTYADSETPIVDELTQKTLPLPLLSQNSYSLIGYYEKGPLSSRLAYTFRDSYLLLVQGAALGGSRYVDDQNQLDASISYALTGSVKVLFDGQNLLRNPEIQFDGDSARVASVRINDRRYFIGASVTF